MSNWKKLIISSRIKMKCRRFNTCMPYVHELCVGRLLGMDVNPGKDPDLTGERAVVEVKFTLLDPRGKYPVAWTVQDHQIEYGKNGKPAYWALGTYNLESPVKEIRTTDEDALEKLVAKREIWIVGWNWMQRYSPSKVSGKTAHSEWENIFRYPKRSELPQSEVTVLFDRGKMHITTDVDISHFDIKLPQRV